MGRHPLKTSDTEGFLRAFWDNLGDTQHDYDVMIAIGIVRTQRKGVFTVSLKAWEGQEGDSKYPKASYSVEYPTAAVGTFEAALYQAAVRLERQLEQQVLHPNEESF